MRKSVTPNKAISFTKLSVFLICAWPPSPLATRSQLLFFNILWCTTLLNAVGLFLPLMGAIFKYSKDPIILGKTVSLCAATIQVITKMSLCRLQLKQFQLLYFDMEDFCKRATSDERIVLQRYVDRYKYIHVAYILWGFLTTVFVISGPLYSPQTFPTHAIYPFSVERQPLKCLIFLHQSLVGFQVSSGMAIDTQLALLLQYTTARFEIFSMHLRRARSDRDLNACIKEHNELLRYTKIMSECVGWIVLAIIATTIIAGTFGSLNLITNQPLTVKVLFTAIVISSSVELFMYAWPADNLMHMSANVANVVYNTNWFEKDISTQKKLCLIMLRSQKLETIRISGVIPKITLFYYAKYLYTLISYFAALRIIIVK